MNRGWCGYFNNLTLILKKYSDGIMLLSNNPKYEPMVFSKQEIIDKSVKIIGKVVELRGKF